MPEKAPVVGRDGEEIGRAEGLLGDLDDDIFHGIVVKLARGGKVEVAANRIPKITTRRVYTDLAMDELDELSSVQPVGFQGLGSAARWVRGLGVGFDGGAGW